MLWRLVFLNSLSAIPIFIMVPRADTPCNFWYHNIFLGCLPSRRSSCSRYCFQLYLCDHLLPKYLNNWWTFYFTAKTRGGGFRQVQVCRRGFQIWVHIYTWKSGQKWPISIPNWEKWTNFILKWAQSQTKRLERQWDELKLVEFQLKWGIFLYT